MTAADCSAGATCCACQGPCSCRHRHRRRKWKGHMEGGFKGFKGLNGGLKGLKSLKGGSLTMCRKSTASSQCPTITTIQQQGGLSICHMCTATTIQQQGGLSICHMRTAWQQPQQVLVKADDSPVRPPQAKLAECLALGVPWLVA